MSNVVTKKDLAEKLATECNLRSCSIIGKQ